MNLQLQSLRIKNFKGIKDLTLQANGENMSVFGDNATGKTTIIDSFQWLLFDKDSNDRSDTSFTIKPQDENGKDINHLQTLVEAELLVDGKILKIKKTKEEKWVKRQGSSEKVFDRHEKSYWFDEVPTKATPYKAKIDELITEDIFKMITNPLYFNTKLSWQERREILLQISGDLTNDQVIESEKSLSSLTNILNGRSIDDYKLVLADQLKGYRKERDDIPPRIDELTLSLPQTEPNYSYIEIAMLELKDSLAHIEFQLTDAKDETVKQNKKHQEMYLLKEQLQETKNTIKSNNESARREFIDEKMKLDNQIYLFSKTVQETSDRAELIKSQTKSKETELQRLREQWTILTKEKAEVMAMEYIEKDINKSCPTCGQNLPEETLENKQGVFKANFEKDKQSQMASIDAKLEENKSRGTSAKASLDRMQTSGKELLSQLDPLDKQIKELTTNLDTVNKEIEKPIAEPEYLDYPNYVELIEKIEKIRLELEKPVENKSTELLQSKSEIQTKIDDCNKILNSKTDIEKKKERIEKLKADETRVSTLIAELEGHKFLLERFIVTKVNLLEDSINSQFKHVKFKLFEENISNDGIKETCIALVNTNGSYIKFEDGNSAGRINSGIDIINSLSKFYGVTSTIFIDNRESVTRLADTDSQVISLIVSEQDKELRMEVEE